MSRSRSLQRSTGSKVRWPCCPACLTSALSLLAVSWAYQTWGWSEAASPAAMCHLEGLQYGSGCEERMRGCMGHACARLFRPAAPFSPDCCFLPTWRLRCR